MDRKEQLAGLWKEAQANQRRLLECAGPHDFVDQTPRKQVGKEYKCSMCQGTIDGSALYWYRQGLRHGKEEHNKTVDILKTAPKQAQEQ